jgi:hypothetical protein
MNYLTFRQNAHRTFSNVSELYPELNSMDLHNKLQKLHCVIGIMTEVQEMIEGLIVGDVINMKEEIGDMLWYIANYDNMIDFYGGEELEFFDKQVLEKTHVMDITPLKNPAELLLDMWKKKVFYNTDKYDNMIANTMANLKHEVVKFCQKNEWDINAIMHTNIEKLQARYPEKFTTDKADNRDLKTERKILEK